MSYLFKILSVPLAFAWHLLNQFLLSPWGLVVPMTILIALFASQQLRKAPVQLALYYADQFETCSEEDLHRLIEVLVRMDNHGVPGLVKGLTSQHESVVTACLKVLQDEFNRWTESEQRDHHYLIFSEALLDMCGKFPPSVQTEVMRFVDQMTHIRSATSNSPESKANRQKTIACCEQLLLKLESVRRRRVEQGQYGGYGLLTRQPDNSQLKEIAGLHSSFAPSTKAVASLDRRARQQTLFASNGQPLIPTSAPNDVPNEMDKTQLAYNPPKQEGADFNAFSVARADRLAAYQRYQQNQWAKNGGNGNSNASEDRATPLLASFSSPTGSLSDMVPPSYSADVASKFSRHFTPDDSDYSAAPTASDVLTPSISEEYRNRKLSESGGTFDSDNFLTPELQNMPLDRVPHLPPTQLMKLLHHPESAYVESARRTLMSRDGFQDVHMNLAWRLYHPIPAVRREIMDMLPGTPHIQPTVWMTVLLNDPNNEVRYRTASFLATTDDPALQRLLIDRGKRDSDARIVNLADRLNAVQFGAGQRGNVRR